MSHDKRSTAGFTVTELMLAMSFVSVLLLAVAFSVIQISVIYTKGITLKEVNQVGRLTSDDLTRTIASGGSFDLSTNYFELPTGGRLCVDGYSYVWNYAEALEAGNPGVLRYQSGGVLASQEIHLAKVPDPGSDYCARTGSTFVLNSVRVADQPQTREMLAAGERLLGIHDFEVSSSATAVDSLTRQQIYSVRYVIGSDDVSALNPERTECLAPADVAANFTYCAVQEFSLVIRAGNGV